jgi:hypothetical protein
MTLNTAATYKSYKEAGGKLAYDVYKEIIFTFHKKMINACISTGNEWHLQSHLGRISIIRAKRKFTVLEDGSIRGSVDWGESNKKKKRILDSGQLPLEVYKDEKGNKVGDNGGVPWLCYFTDTYYYLWKYTPNLYLSNSLDYKFSMSWANTKKLSASINEDSPLLYDE